ncbi:MAG: hypothetical protein PHC88_05550 [Terrimicrobiaceae bacterium]|nr:hypothetical protein [Terrimicrobiaceae bacterium]
MEGLIYESSIDFYDDDGCLIRRVRRTPEISIQGLRLFFSRLEVLLEAGGGLATGQGSDPKLMVRHSDDGGHTWSNERWVSMGKQGEYQRRAVLNRLSSPRCRTRIFELVCTEPIKQVWIDLFIDLTGGRH